MNNEIIYEIYPLTFNYAEGSDSDPYKGAYGNLKGVTEMADYVKDLGVDTVWLAPFYKWNKTGMGYDIIDYYNVDPMFGTNEDFRELVETYHKKGLRVIIDQVYNHCSAEHPWFKKSVQKEDPYTDYFVWVSPKEWDENGKPVPPNNWPSTWDSSGNSVWAWNEERQQFYMHSFDISMPNLNLNNPVVRAEMLSVAKHWLDMGVDGFRLDGSCHYGYDPRLLDNPLLPDGEQMRIYDINHKLGQFFLDDIQKLVQSYPGRKTLLSEFVFDKGKYGNAKGVHTIQNSICSAFYIGSLTGKLPDFKTAVENAAKLYEKMGADSLNAPLIAIATYNCGEGRMEDIMNLAKSIGRNHLVWDTLATVIPLLQKRDYYMDTVVKLGKFKGTETLKYMEQINERYLYYKEEDAI